MLKRACREHAVSLPATCMHAPGGDDGGSGGGGGVGLGGGQGWCNSLRRCLSNYQLGNLKWLLLDAVILQCFILGIGASIRVFKVQSLLF